MSISKKYLLTFESFSQDILIRSQIKIQTRLSKSLVLLCKNTTTLTKHLFLLNCQLSSKSTRDLSFCLATIFQDKNPKLFLQDIVQVYMQSTSYFNREFFIIPPIKLIEALGAKLLYIFKMMKPLYGITKAKNHFFITYHDHHIKKLGIKQSIYNSYLL